MAQPSDPVNLGFKKRLLLSLIYIFRNFDAPYMYPNRSDTKKKLSEQDENCRWSTRVCVGDEAGLLELGKGKQLQYRI